MIHLRVVVCYGTPVPTPIRPHLQKISPIPSTRSTINSLDQFKAIYILTGLSQFNAAPVNTAWYMVVR